MSLSSACVTSSVLPDSRTCAGSDPGSGFTAATACVSGPDSCLSGPVTKWRRSSPLRSMSTMTHAPSASDSSRAQRCRVTDSLNVTFSSSSRLAVVARSSRRVITVTTGSGGACPARDRGPAPAAGLPGPSAGRSRAATSSQSSPPRTLTGRTSSTQLIRPLAVSSWQSSCRPPPVRAAAASSDRTAGRPAGSTSALNGFPVG